ncbi:MAG: aminoglycoside phosphotransferase family protein [Caldilineales bacterium]|nr:aminoglycoside phosphotransferase family protein [Caldilineales bacterium]
MNPFSPSPADLRLFLEGHPLELTSVSTLDRDARLAFLLLDFICASQHPETGAWIDSNDPQRILRNVCHALEALYLLGPASPAQEHLKNGLAWLVNLSEHPPDDGDTGQSPRYNPSRFKTLAWLEHFGGERIQEDFETLGRLWREDRLDLPRPYLATLVYLDTLHWLDRRNQSISRSARQRGERGLMTVKRAMTMWAQNPNEPAPFHSWQELSYALDVLKRYGYLDDEGLRHTLRERLQQVVSRTHRVNSEALYCAIQLLQHFREQPVACAPAEELLTRLYTDYARKGEVVQQDFVFHCLVLRLLLTRHGPELGRAISTRLFRMHQETDRQVRREQEQELRNELTALIAKQLQVEIREAKAISGGMRAEKVYEVEFVVRLPGYAEGRSDMAYEARSGRIVVKRGRHADLSRAVEAYRHLPNGIRHLFANHGHDPIAIPTPQGMQGYLVMEDLKDKQTLEAFLVGMDRIAPLDRHRARLEGVLAALGEALRKVHKAEPFRCPRDKLPGDHLARLYLGPMENAGILLSSRGPRLQLESQRWEYNGRTYHPLGHYLRVLNQNQHTRILRPPVIGLVHGDCHTRNIMIDQDSLRVIFIDLDHMSQNGDYIDDYAILLEDACLYRYLRDPHQIGHIAVEGIHYQRRRDVHSLVVDDLSYRKRNLPRHFQEALFVQIEQEAQQMHDGEYWRPRLWLATAARLLTLAARVEVTPYVILLCAEAVRLLDELEAYLDEGEPLPALLFGAEVYSPRPSPGDSLLDLVESVRRALPTLDPHIQSRRCEFRTAEGRVAALLLRPLARPGRPAPLRLALALPPTALADLAPAVESFASGDLQAVLDLPDETEAAAALVVACLQRVVGKGTG